MLAHLGLTQDLWGETLLPVWTGLRPVRVPGLDALIYLLYNGARSGSRHAAAAFTLAPEAAPTVA